MRPGWLPLAPVALKVVLAMRSTNMHKHPNFPIMTPLYIPQYNSLIPVERPDSHAIWVRSSGTVNLFVLFVQLVHPTQCLRQLPLFLVGWERQIRLVEIQVQALAIQPLTELLSVLLGTLQRFRLSQACRAGRAIHLR